MADPFYLYLSLMLAPICSVVTWLAGRQKRKIDNVNGQQDTVHKLLEHNQELTNQIIKLQNDIIELQQSQARLLSILTAEQLMQYQLLSNDNNHKNHKE
ncbi:MAG: hypothetical protein J6Y72_01390 [Bacteroidales bacterium]|nr:hypothetical protein [Bacteroidales bacterium]